MSNAFVKNLPWIAPTVAILAVGSGVLDRINIIFDGNEQAVAETANLADGLQTDPAVAAIAAVEPIEPVVAPAVVAEVAPVAESATNNVADQLAALLTETATPEVGADVEVTRNAGFSIDTLEQATDVAIENGGLAVEPETGALGSDFFAAAQANLARDRQCIEELRALAAQARVYFPSGGLTGEQGGIGQARILGLLAQQCPGVTIQVEGHSDPSGNPIINERLSLERAEAVVTRVAASGIDPSLFQAVGRGSTTPSLVSGPQPSSYYDRRVEFSIVETETLASFVAPTFGAGGSQFQTAACVAQLTSAVQGTSIEYAPRGMTVSVENMAVASRLADIAANCPEARLRLVGQHSDDPRAGEDGSTGRLRAVVLMNELVNAGFPAEQLILAAPSDARPINGLSDSRVDFDVILEEL